MISRSQIANWRPRHNWLTDDQVEQDFLLSQAICEIGNDELLSSELVLRGGTAYHKLFLPEPLRYSEDLDYVRTSAGGIGDIMKSLTALGQKLGFEVRTKPGMYPKVFWRYVSESGTKMKIKIEMNTFERSPMLELQRIRHAADTPYYSTSTDVLTFQAEELVATKIRALYQRSKGRDLFDLWLALVELELNPETIVKAFPAYRPDGMTRKSLLENLKAKLSDPQFRSDMDNLADLDKLHYDVDSAADLFIQRISPLL